MTTLPAFTFAFQPIVNAVAGVVVSHEALVRGPNGESAFSVLQSVEPPMLYELDEVLRIEAIRMAVGLERPEQLRLNLNLMPRSLEWRPTAIDTTMQAAAECGISPEQITLEVTEQEIIGDIGRFVAIVNEYRGAGVRFAIDDFGAGYAGLNLLAEFQPETIKLDVQLVRGIESRGPRQAIVRGLYRTCVDLGIDVLAEGVETEAEYRWFRNEGVELFQGYLFARPAVGELPAVTFPDRVAAPVG